MTDLRQAAQQALEAWDNPMGMKDLCVAIDALRKALEQPEQEPSQWRDMVVVNLVREGINKHKARDLADHFATTPPAAQRKPLPFDAVQFKCRKHLWIHASSFEDAYMSGFRDAEAAHGIKEGA